MSLPHTERPDMKTLYPNANPLALDLLSKMLQFHPKNRPSADECIRHPYFAEIGVTVPEPRAEEPFNADWDNFEPTKEILQKMVFTESLSYHPGTPPEISEITTQMSSPDKEKTGYHTPQFKPTHCK